MESSVISKRQSLAKTRDWYSLRRKNQALFTHNTFDDFQEKDVDVSIQETDYLFNIPIYPVPNNSFFQGNLTRANVEFEDKLRKVNVEKSKSSLHQPFESHLPPPNPRLGAPNENEGVNNGDSSSRHLTEPDNSLEVGVGNKDEFSGLGVGIDSNVQSNVSKPGGRISTVNNVNEIVNNSFSTLHQSGDVNVNGDGDGSRYNEQFDIETKETKDTHTKRPFNSVKSEFEKSLQTSVAMDNKVKPVVCLSTDLSLLDLSNIHSFVSNPVQKGFLVECYIVRKKGTLRTMFRESFECYLQHNDRLIMTVHSEATKSGAYYNFFSSPSKPNDSSTPSSTSETSKKPTEKVEKQSTLGKSLKSEDHYLGKLRAAPSSSTYMLYDNGLNPFKTKILKKDIVRREFLGVMYEKNVVFGRSPRKITCVVPSVIDGKPTEYKPLKEHETLWSEYKLDSKHTVKGMVTKESRQTVLVNRLPVWNSDLNAYVLDFHGRVTSASIKNFQLVVQDSDDLVLQLGRLKDGRYILDFTWPLSPFQALAIGVSSLDCKIE